MCTKLEEQLECKKNLFIKCCNDEELAAMIIPVLSYDFIQKNQPLRRICLLSKEEKALGKKYKEAGIKFVEEHPVPINILCSEIIKAINNHDAEMIEFLFEKFSSIPTVVVTKEEDKKLSEKYQTTMPEGWDLKTGDIWARYRECGIRKDLYE